MGSYFTNDWLISGNEHTTRKIRSEKKHITIHLPTELYTQQRMKLNFMEKK